MKIRLSAEVIQKIPGTKIAVIVLKNIYNNRKSSTMAQLLRGVFAMRKKDLQKENRQEKIDTLLQPTLEQASTLPETFLLQSLLKKTQKSTEVKSENNAVDLAHYIALKYLTPIMGYDLDEVEKDIEIKFFIPKKGKKGPDLNFTSETKNIVLWLTHIGSLEPEIFEKLPYEVAALFQKYCGGSEPQVYFLNNHETEADLYYVSEKEENYRNSQQNLDQADQSIPEQNSSTFENPFSEMLLKEKLKLALAEAAQKVIATLNLDRAILNNPLEIQIPREKNHGDYSNNFALKLGKILQRNPRELAEMVIQNMPQLPFIEKTEIAGAGFINFQLSADYLQKELQKILDQKENYGRYDFGHGQKVIIEYSSPNIAKPLGAHHLMTTILGQILVNLYRFGNYEVIAGNYLGDWGTQFGKMIYAYQTWGDRQQIEQDPINELLKLYVRFHDEAEKDPTLEDKGRAEFKKLEDGDEKNRELWQWMRDISLKDHDRLNQKMGVHFDEYFPESMYEQHMKKILEDGKQKGVFVPGERGALIVQFENDDMPPYLMQKADGATLYSTRDLASIKDRIERFHPEKMLYVVDVAQSLHLKQLFATAKKMGYDIDTKHDAIQPSSENSEPRQVELIHVVFGRMQLPEGSMSTRKGTIIALDELFKEAESRTAKIVEMKSPELAPDEKKKIIEGLAIGAIKYHIISQNRETNLIFDWDRMLALDGNSAPYLQYAYARAQSILRKAEEAPKNSKDDVSSTIQSNIFEAANFHEEQKEAAQRPAHLSPEKSEKSEEPSLKEDLKPFGHPAEQALLRELAKFPEYIEQAIEHNKPNLLSNYLYELTQIFSAFYQEVPVLTASEPELRSARLSLVKGFQQVIKNGLDIFGIATFERM